MQLYVYDRTLYSHKRFTIQVDYRLSLRELIESCGYNVRLHEFVDLRQISDERSDRSEILEVEIIQFYEKGNFPEDEVKELRGYDIIDILKKSGYRQLTLRELLNFCRVRRPGGTSYSSEDRPVCSFDALGTVWRNYEGLLCYPSVSHTGMVYANPLGLTVNRYAGFLITNKHEPTLSLTGEFALGLSQAMLIEPKQIEADHRDTIDMIDNDRSEPLYISIKHQE